MKDVTKLLINDFNIKKLGYDFMGYKLDRTKDLSFHHLIIPRRLCKQRGLGEGYVYWNGAILNQDTSHEYLHLIEQKDFNKFCAITSEMIDMKTKGHLDIENLRNIRTILEEFEQEYGSAKGKKGKTLIKSEYISKRVQL